jgi:hypothetical protein
MKSVLLFLLCCLLALCSCSFHLGPYSAAPQSVAPGSSFGVAVFINGQTQHAPAVVTVAGSVTVSATCPSGITATFAVPLTSATYTIPDPFDVTKQGPTSGSAVVPTLCGSGSSVPITSATAVITLTLGSGTNGGSPSDGWSATFSYGSSPVSPPFPNLLGTGACAYPDSSIDQNCGVACGCHAFQLVGYSTNAGLTTFSWQVKNNCQPGTASVTKGVQYVAFSLASSFGAVNLIPNGASSGGYDAPAGGTNAGGSYTVTIQSGSGSQTPPSGFRALRFVPYTIGANPSFAAGKTEVFTFTIAGSYSSNFVWTVEASNGNTATTDRYSLDISRCACGKCAAQTSSCPPGYTGSPACNQCEVNNPNGKWWCSPSGSSINPYYLNLIPTPIFDGGLAPGTTDVNGFTVTCGCALVTVQCPSCCSKGFCNSNVGTCSCGASCCATSGVATVSVTPSFSNLIPNQGFNYAYL